MAAKFPAQQRFRKLFRDFDTIGITKFSKVMRYGELKVNFRNLWSSRASSLTSNIHINELPMGGIRKVRIKIWQSAVLLF